MLNREDVVMADQKSGAAVEALTKATANAGYPSTVTP